MRQYLFGIAVASTLAGPAMAADLAPPAPAAPVYNWTGIYLGLNGGGAWGSQDPFQIFTNRFDHVSVNFSGGTVGGTAGAQLQLSHTVIGFEADLNWAGVSGSSAFAPTIFGAPAGFTVNATTHIDWDFTARARVGYALDNYLLYVTGGAAVLGAKTNLTTLSGLSCGSFGLIAGSPGTFPCSGTNTRIGGTVGAGLEYGFMPNWSAKLEYRYTAAASLELSHINEVRAGVNYRFGGF
jgi:outer membrane immunogenic protein